LTKLLGRSFRKDDLESILKIVDNSSYKEVSFEEFLDVWFWIEDGLLATTATTTATTVNKTKTKKMTKTTTTMDPEEELRRIFDSFDADGNGTISGYELKAGLSRLGIQLCDNELDSILRRMVGEINFDQFLHFMMNQ